MKNIFLVDDENKSLFLESIKEKYEKATYELYGKLIYKLDEFEHYKGISAINMSKADFIELLTLLNSSSLSVLYTYKSAISNYLIFLNDATKFKIGILELDNITREDLIECINILAEEKQFITEKEYHEILDDSEGNYQDKLVIILLWNKIKGAKNYNEILNLKNSDVDIENKIITLPDRNVKLTEKEINIVKKAMQEKIYIRVSLDKNNTIVKEEVDCVDSEYLVKSTVGFRNRHSEAEQCPYSTLANRLSKYFNIVLGRSELTGLKIYKSRIYYDLLLDYGRKVTGLELENYLKKNNLRLSISSSFREQDIMFKKLSEQGLI